MAADLDNDEREREGMTLVPLVCYMTDTNMQHRQKTHRADNVPALPDQRKDHSMPKPCSWETSASTTPCGYSVAARYETPSLRHLAPNWTISQPLKRRLRGHGEIFVQKPLLTTLRRVSCMVKCTCSGRGTLPKAQTRLRWSHLPCVLTA